MAVPNNWPRALNGPTKTQSRALAAIEEEYLGAWLRDEPWTYAPSWVRTATIRALQSMGYLDVETRKTTYYRGRSMSRSYAGVCLAVRPRRSVDSWTIVADARSLAKAAREARR